MMVPSVNPPYSFSPLLLKANEVHPYFLFPCPETKDKKRMNTLNGVVEVTDGELIFSIIIHLPDSDLILGGSSYPR